MTTRAERLAMREWRRSLTRDQRRACRGLVQHWMTEPDSSDNMDLFWWNYGSDQASDALRGAFRNFDEATHAASMCEVWQRVIDERRERTGVKEEAKRG